MTFQRGTIGARTHSNSMEYGPWWSVSSVVRGGADAKGVADQGAQSRRLVAIDIGRTGALALFVDGNLADVADMPTLQDGPACRLAVNGPLLAGLIARWAPSEAVCEHVSARPKEAAAGAFAFGRSRGAIEGVLAAQAVPMRFVTPAWWKRRVGIPAGKDMKDMARSIAIARWPHRAEMFARKLDHDRAEAALIGLAFIGERRGAREAQELPSSLLASTLARTR